MENEKFNEPMQRLAYWVFATKFQGCKDDCPKVGYLGYANGMSNTEWLAVCLAEELLIKQGKNWREFFSYKIDSSD